MSPTKKDSVQTSHPAASGPERELPKAMTGAVPVQGFEPAITDHEASKDWKPVSDRKIRVGIAGYGVCGFGAAFHFQDHPNVTVAAVADLDPDKCAELAKACRCAKTYPSCE